MCEITAEWRYVSAEILHQRCTPLYKSATLQWLGGKCSVLCSVGWVHRFGYFNKSIWFGLKFGGWDVAERKADGVLFKREKVVTRGSGSVG